MKKSFDRIVYKTTNLINGKIYIGQDSYNRPRYKGSGKILRLAFKKYGIENFEKEILCFCESQEDLDKMESLWIEKLNAIENGYNILKGGCGTSNLKYIEQMRSSLSGEKNPMYKKSVKSIWVKKFGKEKAEKMWEESNNKRSRNGKNKGTKGVIQFDKDGNKLNEFSAISTAAKETNSNINSIRMVCNKQRKTSNGFVWEWKNKNQK